MKPSQEEGGEGRSGRGRKGGGGKERRVEIDELTLALRSFSVTLDLTTFSSLRIPKATPSMISSTSVNLVFSSSPLCRKRSIKLRFTFRMIRFVSLFLSLSSLSLFSLPLLLSFSLLLFSPLPNPPPSPRSFPALLRLPHPPPLPLLPLPSKHNLPYPPLHPPSPPPRIHHPPPPNPNSSLLPAHVEGSVHPRCCPREGLWSEGRVVRG